MKRILVLAALISLNLTVGNAKNLQALFSFKTFYSPENGPYIETYLSVNGKSVVYGKNANGCFREQLK
ncbi:MAG: hypothetical protein IPN13_12895 [Bacteroidetes bacterium]|nr:hypothetical protein [Bacteroidota bacterium]